MNELPALPHELYAEKATAQKPYEIHMETLHPWASSLKAGCEHTSEHCRKRFDRL